MTIKLLQFNCFVALALLVSYSSIETAIMPQLKYIVMLQLQMLQVPQSTISAIYSMFAATQKEGAKLFYQFLDSLNVTYAKTANYKADSFFYIVLDDNGSNAIGQLHEHFAQGAIIAANKAAAKQAKTAAGPVSLPVPTLYESATAAAAATAQPIAAVPQPIAAVPTIAAAQPIAAQPIAQPVNSLQSNVISEVEYNRLASLKRLKPEQKNAMTIYNFVNGNS